MVRKIVIRKKLKTLNNGIFSTAIGWCISAFGLLQLPIWAIVAIIRQDGATISEVNILLF